MFCAFSACVIAWEDNIQDSLYFLWYDGVLKDNDFSV